MTYMHALAMVWDAPADMEKTWKCGAGLLQLNLSWATMQHTCGTCMDSPMITNVETKACLKQQAASQFHATPMAACGSDEKT